MSHLRSSTEFLAAGLVLRLRPGHVAQSKQPSDATEFEDDDPSMDDLAQQRGEDDDDDDYEEHLSGSRRARRLNRHSTTPPETRPDEDVSQDPGALHMDTAAATSAESASMVSN